MHVRKPVMCPCLACEFDSWRSKVLNVCSMVIETASIRCARATVRTSAKAWLCAASAELSSSSAGSNRPFGSLSRENVLISDRLRPTSRVRRRQCSQRRAVSLDSYDRSEAAEKAALRARL